MKPEELQYLQALADGKEKASADNSGFGIANVAQRLKLNFGDRYGLDIESTYGEGTVITVHTPGPNALPSGALQTDIVTAS
jgi:two-component system sensor histidine kinase YesM